MRKKLILFLVLGILCCCCSSCGMIAQLALVGYELTKDDTSETKNIDEELAIYVEEQFAEKYGKKFEFLNVYSYNFMFSRDCNIKCVDDGIEFQANVYIKDYYKVERENYLIYKYFDEIQNDVIDYVDQYFEDYKLVTTDKTDEIKLYNNSIPFENSSFDLSYEELKQIGNISTDCYIFIPEDTVFSDEEWTILIEKIASYNEYTNDDYIGRAYKKDINLGIYFMVFRIPNEMYHDLEFITTFDEFRKLKENGDYEITRIL
ncbi:MAG: hypothetical protein K2G88_00165 [Oscillospiraceae bacterium]|nr:hypothetical protein [Oscillospiraceae bacterium]